jgi:hypothetical protein
VDGEKRKGRPTQTICSFYEFKLGIEFLHKRHSGRDVESEDMRDNQKLYNNLVILSI